MDASNPLSSAARDLEVVESHLTAMEAFAVIGIMPHTFIIVFTNHYMGFFAVDPGSLQVFLICWGIDRVELYAI